MNTAVPTAENFADQIGSEIETGQPSEIKDIAFDNPILIGGCGSSGTTLLKTILDSHPKIACGQEISIFDHPSVYKTHVKQLHRMYKRQDFSALSGDLVYPIVSKYGDTFGLYSPNFGREYHNPSDTNLIFEMSENLKHFFDIYFSNFAKRHGKSRWAEKTPNNIFCIQNFFDLYPDAKFIHVIRDGRDVVLSLTQSRDFDIFGAIMRWLISVEAGLRFRENPNYYEVKYEDLVTKPEQTLKSLMEFLEEDYDPQMLDFAESGKSNPMNYGSTPIFTKSVEKWKRTELTPNAKMLFDLSMRSTLEKLGYETA